MPRSKPHHPLGPLAALLLLAPLPLLAQTIPGWDLVWSDEFSQADGSVPDPTKWGYDLGGNGWGNNELQYYTDRPENARIEGGQLVIEAREENYNGRDHTSARLLTKGKWDWTYGRFETRLKVPRGEGLWPAFWMLGSNIDSVGWPQCGEIDIMEHVGRLPKEVFGTLHGPGYSGANGIGGTHTFTPDVADDYHTFVVEWDEDLIRWYVDGINFFSATPASLGGSQWVYDHTHFLILNLAIGGNFAGPLGNSTTFPQQLLVDYVRVYSRTVPTGSDVLLNSGFESGSLSPWIGYSLGAGGANAQGGYVESTSHTYYNGGNPGGDNVLTHSGQFVGKVFGDFTGTENFNGFYQDLTADPGSVWTAGGWALTHAQDLMSGSNSSWIEVSFRDASDNVLSLHRSDILTSSNILASTWMELPLTNRIDPSTFQVLGTGSTMEAPAGTTKLRYQVVYRQPLYDGGSMYFDDLSLVQQTVVQPLEVTASIVGNDFLLSFDSQTGVGYTLYSKADLRDATWAPIQSANGTGLNMSFSDPITATQRFFIIGAAPL